MDRWEFGQDAIEETIFARYCSWRFALDNISHVLWCDRSGVEGDGRFCNLREPVQLGAVYVDSLGVCSSVVVVGHLLGEGWSSLLLVKGSIAR